MSSSPLLERLHEAAARLEADIESLELLLRMPSLPREERETARELAAGTRQGLQLMRDAVARLEELERMREANEQQDKGRVLRVEFSRPVASKKNSKERRHFTTKDGGRGNYTGRSRKAQRDEDALRASAMVQAYRDGWRTLQTEDAELLLVWKVGEGLVIEVRSMGNPPAGVAHGRERDLHGMLETVADALRQIAYVDDRQVARVVLERHYPEK